MERRSVIRITFPVALGPPLRRSWVLLKQSWYARAVGLSSLMALGTCRAMALGTGRLASVDATTHGNHHWAGRADQTQRVPPTTETISC